MKIERQREIEKNSIIARLDKRLQQLSNQRKESESLLRNTTKDFVRLSAEMDSLKGEKEQIVREKAIEETWWIYVCSFIPGKAVEFTQQRQRRDCVLVNIIGKQRTKEVSVHHQSTTIRTLKVRVQSVSSAEDEIKAKMRLIEKEWRDRIVQYF